MKRQNVLSILTTPFSSQIAKKMRLRPTIDRSVILLALLWVMTASMQASSLSEIDIKVYENCGTPSSCVVIDNLFPSSEGTVSVSKIFDNAVVVEFRGTSAPGVAFFADVTFEAPFGVLLTPGTYLNATRFPFNAQGTPGLDVGYNGIGQNTLTGQFTILEANYDATGNVQNFGATFEIYNVMTGGPAYTGVAYYNFDLPASTIPEPRIGGMVMLGLIVALLPSLGVRQKVGGQ